MAMPPNTLQSYAAELMSACGGDTPRFRPAELDNTKHVGSCSLLLTPAVIGGLCVLCVLRRLVCREKLRELYSGSEDAPELEEIVASGGGAARRVDTYSSRHGRLVVNSGAGRTEATPTPRPKKSRRDHRSALELEEAVPVLWRRS